MLGNVQSWHLTICIKQEFKLSPSFKNHSCRDMRTPLVPLPSLAGSSHLLRSWSECHSIFWLCLAPHYSALRNMPLSHGICMTYTQSTKNIYALIFPQESGSVATSYISDFYSEVPLLILSTSLLISYHRCDSKLNPFSSSKLQGTH